MGPCPCCDNCLRASSRIRDGFDDLGEEYDFFDEEVDAVIDEAIRRPAIPGGRRGAVRRTLSRWPRMLRLAEGAYRARRIPRGETCWRSTKRHLPGRANAPPGGSRDRASHRRIKTLSGFRRDQQRRDTPTVRANSVARNLHRSWRPKPNLAGRLPARRFGVDRTRARRDRFARRVAQKLPGVGDSA